MAVDYDGFITTVAQAARIGRDDAERATRATLQTLGERIVRGQAQQLAGQLPPGVAPYLEKTSPEAEPFDVDEFVRRVAEREGGIDPTSAERHARAVLVALGRAVSADELDDLRSELPTDIERLLPRGRPATGITSGAAFVDRVAGRAGLDHDRARRATDAVLETLAERIAGGEVDDLIGQLPLELQPPLKRGKAQSGGEATRMSLEEFVRRVAQREGVPLGEALDHSRAVLATLRDAIPGGDFFDVTAQLPHEYDALLAR